LLRCTPGICVVCVAVVGAAATPATVEAKPKGKAKKRAKKAKRLDRLGKKAYAEGRYDDAVAAFEAAHKLVPEPRFLFNLARCWERKGDPVKAVDYVERYLDAMPEGEDREDAEALLDMLRVKLAKAEGEVRVRSEPPGAQVVAAGEGAQHSGVTPWNARLPLGSWRLTVRRDGYQPAERQITVDPTKPVELDVVLERLAKEPEAPKPSKPDARPPPAVVQVETPTPGGAPPPEASGGPVLPWLVLGAGVVAAAGGAVFGILSRQALERRDAAEPRQTTWGEYQEAEDDARTLSMTANALYIAGGLAAATGAALLLLPGGGAAAS